ncbi:MAG TPA: TatD family hydrolase [Candidatus Saccharimonadales bacterium]|nr:TatD family hydrolase [Candidatus Saccharimonadales bacterium]
MEFVDTHCHIQSVGEKGGERTTLELWAKAGDLTSSEVIAQAEQAAVMKLLCVGCDLEDSALAVHFVQDKPQCWASIGIHPHEAQQYAGRSELLSEFASLAARPKVMAIGECGLDYYYNHSSKAAQFELLEFQLALAQQHKLPLIFHVREAFDDFWPIFDRYPGIQGVIHSFTADEQQLENILQRELFVGLNGIMTFTKNPAQLAAAKAVPLQKLLLETDAPFLTPTPYRGTINQPKNVRVVGEFLAKLRGDSLEALARVTTANAQSLFGI